MNPVVILIIIISGVSYLAWKNPEARSKMIFNPYIIDQKKQHYRFITSGFIHADYLHLGFNMYSLYIFSAGIEGEFKNLFGSLWVIHLYAVFILGVIFSSIPTYFKYRSVPYYNSLGASGGVASILFAFVFLHPTYKLYGIFFPFGLPAFLFGIGYLGYSTYQDKKGGDNINHSAHLWGSIFGIVYLSCLKHQTVPNFFEQITNWL